MMAPGPRVPVTSLREAARLRVAATSLRKAAKEIGLSPTGLQGFLDGAEPYAPTVQKLLEWYVREEARKAIQLDPETAAAALSLLVRHLTLPRRSRALRGALVAIAEEGAAGPTPEWLEHLLREHGEESAPPPPEAESG